MKGAIVGFGEVARYGHWPAYAASDELRIVAVVDRSAERREAAEQLAPGLRTYPSLDALASAESIDFVDICTPPAHHGAPMLAALENGWHVVCEKPFLLDRSELARVRRVAEARGLAAVPVHNWAFAPIVREATERLRRGVIGRLERVEIETERQRDFRGADPARANWRRDPAIAGGGILMDHGWHGLYLVLQWFEAQPVEVDASFHRSTPVSVEDEADVRLTFPVGEASIKLTWNGAVRRNAVVLTGACGSIRIDDDCLIVRSPGGDETVKFAEALSGGSHHADWFAALIPRLAGYFQQPRTASAAFDEAAACLAIIRRAYEKGDGSHFLRHS